MAHLEHYTRRYVEVLRRRPVQSSPDVPILATAGLPELVAALREARASLRSESASIGEGDWAAPCRGDMTVRDFVLLAIRHETWHAGQIVVVRRLFRTQERAVPAFLAAR